MDHTKPADVVAAMIEASVKKLAVGPRDILIRGALSGALLGAATGSIAFGILIAISLTNMGKVMGSTSTVGKIAAIWLPIFLFFALGFEHAVVNMFVIPTGMLLGAKVSVSDWWLWNQIPVTLGNLVGGFVFTGLALYATYKPVRAPVTSTPVVIPAAAE